MGTATYVLVSFGWNGYSEARVSHRETPQAVLRPTENAMSRAVRNFYAPYGALAPVQYYAWLATRHRALYGTTDEQMGEMALTCRAHAQHNPLAYMYGRPLTMESCYPRRRCWPHLFVSWIAVWRPMAPAQW